MSADVEALPYAERSSSGPPSSEPEGQEAVGTPGAVQAYPGLGPMLEDDERRVCETVERELRRRARARKILAARWERNAAWRRGLRNVSVVEDPTTGEAWVRYGFGSAGAPPSPNKTDALIRKVNATMLVDPPQGEAEPATDDDADRDAAELATRILTADQEEIRRHMAAALDVAGHCASGYVYVCVDPTGGGWEPLTLTAHPAAVHEDAPLVDPASGQPA